jgi:hypothetical protein
MTDPRGVAPVRYRNEKDFAFSLDNASVALAYVADTDIAWTNGTYPDWTGHITNGDITYSTTTRLFTIQATGVYSIAFFRSDVDSTGPTVAVDFANGALPVGIKAKSVVDSSIMLTDTLPMIKGTTVGIKTFTDCVLSAKDGDYHQAGMVITRIS